MTKTARVYAIERLIRARGCVSFQQFLDELEVSPATLKRDLAYLKDQLEAPIAYDREANGYRFAGNAHERRHELPGLWFSERELYSLLMTHQMLSELDGEGLISRHLQPLLERVHHLLGSDGADARDLMKRVRLISPAKRPVPGRWFEQVGEALMKRQRLHLRYLTRGRGAVGEREVSPQRLVHYRNTWYLDAWCHKVDGLRRFALDAIEASQTLPARAKDVPVRQLQAEMDAGYGIYAGGRPQWATLVFAPKAAQWVSHEVWHPDQTSRWLADGQFELKVPYAEPREMVMDILRHGDQVSVLGPASLVEEVTQQLSRALGLYRRKRKARPATP
jgi:predicted DNA-binding transcriptional regulator YafY